MLIKYFNIQVIRIYEFNACLMNACVKPKKRNEKKYIERMNFMHI